LHINLLSITTQLVRDDDGTVYAAKAFYQLSNEIHTIPADEENLAALQQELVLTTIATSICDDFNGHAESLKVGISG
jgi:hypothetical protein